MVVTMPASPRISRLGEVNVVPQPSSQGFSKNRIHIQRTIQDVHQILYELITLNKNLPGPDRKASINPKELEKMIEGVRKITIALGHGIKKISPSERKNIKNNSNSKIIIIKSKKILYGHGPTYMGPALLGPPI